MLSSQNPNPKHELSERDESSRRYWDGVGEDWGLYNRDQLWRQYSDAIHIWWLERVVHDFRGKLILKTDLFDEAYGNGLTAWFEQQGGEVVGCDLAATIAEQAAKKQVSIAAVVSDVKHLPFSADTFDCIFSDSTLDHFESEREIQQALHELFRVLRPGGILLLTMDNPRNPIVWLRNQKPEFWRRLKLVPYKVGVTCNYSRCTHLLTTAGFEVVSMGTLMHSPRVLLVPVCRWLEQLCKQRHPGSKGLYLMRCFEKLQSLPSNQLTGHFFTALGQKPLC